LHIDCALAAAVGSFNQFVAGDRRALPLREKAL
jgi:hypothetical protein